MLPRCTVPLAVVWVALTPGVGESLAALEERITGGEWIHWNQQASSASELESFAYAVYVNDVRSLLPDVECSEEPDAAGFECRALLPALSPGRHILQLATVVMSDGGSLESGRSPPILLLVDGLWQPAAQSPAWTGNALVTTSDRLPLVLDLLAEGLSDPVDLAVAPDGRLFVAERGGTVRIVRDGRLQTRPALIVEEVPSFPPGGLHGVAIDPEFPRNRFVYLVYTVPADAGGLVFRVARFREVDGSLAERAILLDEIPARPGGPAAALRFGPDGKLYVALDDGGDGRRREDLASFNGKILRLEPDGTMPADRPTVTPVFADGFEAPRGLDWRFDESQGSTRNAAGRPSGAPLWAIDGRTEGPEHLTLVATIDDEARGIGASVRYALPPGGGVVSMAFYRAGPIRGLRGDLLIAAGEGRHILRVRFEGPAGTTIVATERLLEDRVGPIRTVAAGPDGLIYFCTDRAIGRLLPE